MERSAGKGRIAAAVAAAALQVLLGYVLIAGLAVRVPIAVRDTIKLFDIAPSRPAPPVRKLAPRPRHRTRPAAAAPTNIRAKPLDIVVPPVVVEQVALPPVAAAPAAGEGREQTAGAATPGPGTGAGGPGNGTGSGDDGAGDGDDWTPSRWIKGRITSADYPAAAAEARIGGSLTTRYVVWTTGRVTECTVTRSSGNADLDATTCRLIVERFRFKPARDAHGRIIPDVVTEEHVWVIGR